MNAENLPDAAARAPALTADALIVGRFDVGPEYAVGRRDGSPSWVLMWTVRGAGQITQGASQLLAERGDLVLLAPGVRHSYRVAEEVGRWRFWWAHFQPRVEWFRRLRSYGAQDGCYRLVVAGTTRRRVDATMRRMLCDATWSGRGEAPPSRLDEHGRVVAVAAFPTARELAMNAIEEVLLLAAPTDAATSAGGRPQRDQRIREVEALIMADPAGAYTVSSLAARAGLSASRFAHAFAAETGSTPMAAVRAARLRNAGQLLLATELSVGQIATACGFVDPFHFSRVFRQAVGMSPRQFRIAGSAGSSQEGGGDSGVDRDV